MFDILTQQKLGSYVYMLVNPIDNNPFYIGKGKNNRVFDHINLNINDCIDGEDLKLEIIAKIKKAELEVEHIIIKHGMSEKEALAVESALIDTLNHCGILLANKVLGHYSIEKGLMTVNHLKSLYNAEPLDYINTDCLLININKRYKRDKGEQALYEATKGVWAINKNKLLDKNGNVLIKYVLSEYKGLIREVFEVEEWYSAPRPFGPKAQKHGQDRSGMAFNGKVASEEIRHQYLLKSIAHLKKRGSAIAHRFTI